MTQLKAPAGIVPPELFGLGPAMLVRVLAAEYLQEGKLPGKAAMLAPLDTIAS
jgi:hypothetical protein